MRGQFPLRPTNVGSEARAVMSRVIYRPLAMIVSSLGGIVAGVLFKQVWKRVSGDGDAPKATDGDHSWREVVLAAAVQGAIFGAVKATVDRAGAAGYRKATGEWPSR